MVMLWWCYDVMRMLRWCYDDVMIMLRWCYDVTTMLRRCYDDVVMMLWWCYEDVTMMLWSCYDNVMMMLRWCYDDVMMMLWYTPLLTAGISALSIARATLYLTDKNLQVTRFWRSVAGDSIANSHRKIKPARKLETTKEQGITRASNPRVTAAHWAQKWPVCRSFGAAVFFMHLVLL